MGKEKIAITLDEYSLSELDRLVDERVFQSRSQAIREAISEKLVRMKRVRLAEESAKLKPSFEQSLSEQGFTEDMKQWPKY